MASDDVIKLDFPEHVRLRPNLYIGETTDASVILREAIDNSVDELYKLDSPEGKSDTIWIENINNQTYLVADNARGIPIKESATEGWTMARLAVGSLNAGSKFAKNSIATGMHGQGVSCTNALSTRFKVLSKANLHDLNLIPNELKKKLPEVINGTTYYFCEFREGQFIDEGFTEYESPKFGGAHPSTITIFSPDPKIFKSTRAKLPSSLPYVTYIMKCLGKKSHIYYNGEEFRDSIESFGYDLDVTIKSKNEDSRNPELRFLITLGLSQKLEPCEVIGSVNGLDCGGGVHIRMAQNAFCRAFSQVFSNCRRYELMGVKMGVIALCNDPSFSSQTKERLADIDGFKSSGDYEVSCLADGFKKIFKNNYDVFKNHELKILEYLKSTEKIGRKEFIKSTVLIASNTSRADAFTPRKLTDCSSVNRRECELYLVEGQSAKSSLMDCRDPKIHALLGLRGKPLNTTSLEIEQVLSNQEMKDLISSIGVGVNDYHDMSEVRYGKVIIVADADPDGMNIDALLLGALATHLTFLIEAGCVYIAKTPLYRQNGKYFFDDKGLDLSKPFSRFKGLGEANPEDLEPFVFNKQTRQLVKITMDNWEDAQDMLTSSRAKRQIMIQKGIINENLIGLNE